MVVCNERLVLDVAQVVRDTFTRWARRTYRQCMRAATVIDLLLKESGCDTDSTFSYAEYGWMGRVTGTGVPAAKNTGHVWNIVRFADGNDWLLDVTADQFNRLLKKQFPPIIWGPRQAMIDRYGYIYADDYRLSVYDVHPQFVTVARHRLRTGRWLKLPTREQCALLK